VVVFKELSGVQMREITVVMLTVDRTPHKNYLAETLKNLERGEVWKSKHLNSFHLFDSGGFKGWPGEVLFGSGIQGEIHVHMTEKVLLANENVATALEFAAGLKSKWVLFLEDDIDVCGKFLDSVFIWLEEQEEYLLYSFGACYPDVSLPNKTSWKYPVNCFYGTQAIAFHSEMALNFSIYLSKNIFLKGKRGVAHDLLMAEWSKTRWPENKYFLASAPSFVQHIGMESVIDPRDKVHVFPSFQGNEWSYRQKEGMEK
jgi:hypothetical protein